MSPRSLVGARPRSRRGQRDGAPALRVFVTATDTGVGKTQVASALLSLLADAGLSPAPFKPYESGCSRLSGPADALELRLAARSTDRLDRVCVHRFRAALAPGVASRPPPRSGGRARSRPGGRTGRR